MHRSLFFLKPGLLIVFGLLLLGAATAEFCFLKSKGHRTVVNTRASEEFGKALERAGIQTQPEASK